MKKKWRNSKTGLYLKTNARYYTGKYIQQTVIYIIYIHIHNIYKYNIIHIFTYKIYMIHKIYMCVCLCECVYVCLWIY